MKEQELNTIMAVVTDPIKNVYRVDSFARQEEKYFSFLEFDFSLPFV